MKDRRGDFFKTLQRGKDNEVGDLRRWRVVVNSEEKDNAEKRIDRKAQQKPKL